MSKSPKLGPTGTFPHGRHDHTDEGAINIEIGGEGKNVVIRFGKKIAWIGFSPNEAIAFASAILKHATGATGFVLGTVEPLDAENLGRRGQGDPEVEPRRQ